MVDFPINDVRARFPALRDTSRVYLDGPGGTQLCAPAIARMVAHLEAGTANSGGVFRTSVETDALSDAAHAAMADLLGGDASEIAFGQNMTTLTLGVSRALARDWRAGDELVLSRLCHDANVAPWLAVADDVGMAVRWIDFDPTTGVLALDTLPALLNERTRLVAVGGASNAIGTVNDIPAISRVVRRNSDALIYVDGVQSVPHLPTDVRAMECDFLACSPYKFFGPHQGVLWGRREVLTRIKPYKVRPAASDPPGHAFETGTPSFEGQAAVLGTVEYLDWLGGCLLPGAGTRRERLLAAMAGCMDYERELGERLLEGLRGINALRLWGVAGMDGRVPTFGFTHAHLHPDAMAAALAERGIYAWSGNFYAVEVIARMGLEPSGGLLRLGLCHYNTADEVDRTVEAMRQIAQAKA